MQCGYRGYKLTDTLSAGADNTNWVRIPFKFNLLGITMEIDMPKFAACVLVKNDKGLFLALLRSDGKGYGFPGGKHDPGEELKETAVREAFEETGHVVVCNSYTDTFISKCKEHTVATYVAKTVAIGAPTHAHEGEVVWATKEQLLNESAFGQYNKECFEFFKV